MSVPALDKTGSLLCAAGCAVSPLVVFLAMPPFYSGIWVQVETVVVALHVISALAGFGLLLLAVSGSEEAKRAVTHPFAVLPLLAAAWTAALLPFIDQPSLSWFGAPELRVGGLAMLDLAVLTAAAIAIRQRRLVWRIVVCSAVVATLGTLLSPFANAFAAIAGTTFMYGREVSPYFFSDYRAFYAIFIVVLIVGLDVPYRKTAWAAALLLGAVVLYASHNKAAIGYAAVIIPAVFVLRRMAGDDGTFRRLSAWAAGLVPVALTGFIYAVGMAVLAGAQSGDPLARTLIEGVPTLWSRSLMTDLVVEGFTDAPSTLLTGFGWGHFGETLLRHLNEIPVRLYVTIGSKNLPFWDAVSRFDFHSHNVFVESLLAGGGVGLILSLAYMAAIPLFARDGGLALAGAFALVLGAIGTFWFQMPVSLPLMALAAASLAGTRTFLLPLRLRFVLVALLCGVGPVAQLTSALAGIAMAERGDMEVRANNTADNTPAAEAVAQRPDCRPIMAATGIGDAHLGWLFQNYVGRLSARSHKGEALSEAQVARLVRYLCATDKRLSKSRSLRLFVATLNARAALVFQFDQPEITAAVAPYLENWGERLRRLLDLAPRRTDLATAYMNWLLAQGREEGLLRFAGKLLSVNPQDPVGLWFSGTVLLARPGRAAEGLSRMRRSLEWGIQNLMPIDRKILEAIRNST